MPDKLSIRKRVLEKRDSLTPDILERASKTAAEKLIAMEEYIHANTVMVYMDIRNEVPTGRIIDEIRRSGRKLVLPLKTKDFRLMLYHIPNEGNLNDYLAVSGFGIPEPDPALCREADPSALDLIIIPGSVFDQFGNRIGYGKAVMTSCFHLWRQRRSSWPWPTTSRYCPAYPPSLTM
jgi:5-formyltetrahydrofolate cyclo-ligase